MIETQIPEKMINEGVAFLSRIDLFKHFKVSTLKSFTRLFTLVSITGSEELIRQGDIDPTLYILMKGRLRVYIESSDSSSNDLKPIGEISVGQVVGEIALLTDSPRTSTVKAVRDSFLLKMSSEAFKQFKKDFPKEVAELSITALKRLLVTKRPTTAGENIKTIAVAPAGQTDHVPFVNRFAEKLSESEIAIVVNSKVCDDHFGRKFSEEELNNNDNELINTWLQNLENLYSYVIYETDNEMTSWTERCLRQSDRLIFVADDSLSPELNQIEKSLTSQKVVNLSYLDLVIIHPDDLKIITGTREWLQPRNISCHHHLRMTSSTDWSKFIRFLTGKSLGLVLNGGGARGYAHIGILKALEELNIPVDFIAGTSMGSLVGGSYCLSGLSNTENCARKSERKKLTDYTFPYISLMRGKGQTDYIQDCLGFGDIEDLWTRFFCVSSNLTRGKEEIHDRGPLWLAVKASCSIPGLYPPIYNESGDALVDGGIINNMPVDIMRKCMGGGKVLAVNCHIDVSEKRKEKILKTWISGWSLAIEHLNPFQKAKDYDKLLNIVIDSMTLSVRDKEKSMENAADYVIRCDTGSFSSWDYARSEKIIELGYRTGLKLLPEILIQGDD